jgi:predicted acetyltransferase
MNLTLLSHAEGAARIENQMPAYLEEMTQFEPEAEVTLTYPYLGHYWRESDRFPFVITHDGQDCGFALIRRIAPGDGTGDYHAIAEFFIQPGFRRRGLGAGIVAEVLQRFPGKWLIQVLELNQPARHFWQGTLDTISGQTLQPEFDGRFYNYWLKV